VARAMAGLAAESEYVIARARDPRRRSPRGQCPRGRPRRLRGQPRTAPRGPAGASCADEVVNAPGARGGSHDSTPASSQPFTVVGPSQGTCRPYSNLRFMVTNSQQPRTTRQASTSAPIAGHSQRSDSRVTEQRRGCDEVREGDCSDTSLPSYAQGRPASPEFVAL
jgi:hypothetical protein